ncbi:hypothetical protein [Falsiroseomonas sp. CW058]
MRGSESPRLPRFARRRPAPAPWTAQRVLDLVHKLLTAGAAAAALAKALF